MKLHKGKSLAAAVGGLAVLMLSAAPLVASADNAHFGVQYRGSNFSYGNNNNNDNNYNNGNDGNNNQGDWSNNPPGGNYDWVPPTQVPEPGTLALILGGLAGLLGTRLRRRRSK